MSNELDDIGGIEDYEDGDFDEYYLCESQCPDCGGTGEDGDRPGYACLTCDGIGGI